jgi:hypothetical protein
MGKLSPRQPNNDQKLDKANGRNHEQIHGRDVWHMIAHERAPALTRRLASLGRNAGDAQRHHQAKAPMPSYAQASRNTAISFRERRRIVWVEDSARSRSAMDAQKAQGVKIAATSPTIRNFLDGPSVS